MSAARAAAVGARAAGGGRMVAWRLHGYGGAGELRLESARVPALRRTDELLVRVHAASLNPLDVAMTGGYGSRVLNTLRRLEGTEMEFPLVLGRDLCGTVVRAGPAARLRPGARVWAVLPPHSPGALAQYATVRDAWAGEAPRALDTWSAAGALYAGLTACSALRAGGVAGAGRARGERVLLLGLGGVGQAALQLLAHSEAQVVVGCTGEQAHLAERLGACEALDRHAAEYEGAVERAGPYALVLDCSGAGGWEASARRWRFRRYVTLTTPLLRETDARGLLPGAARALADLAGQTLAVLRARDETERESGGAWCAPPVRWAYFSAGRARDDIALLRALADAGKFTVEVERVYPWWDAPEGFARAARGHARGKLVVDLAASLPAPLPGPAAGS